MSITCKEKQSYHCCCESWIRESKKQPREQPVPNKHTDKSSPLLMENARTSESYMSL